MPSTFFDYYQKLLLAHYDVADEFVHKSTMGTIREDFLKNLIMGRHRNIMIKSGELVNDRGIHSPQCDGLFCKRSTPLDPPNSPNVLMDIQHCKLVLEIKSKLRYEHLKKANKDAEKIKGLDGTNIPLYGLFAYHLDLKKEQLLRRFGLRYDKDLDAFQLDENLNIKYPNLDFVMAISKDSDFDYQFFIRKNAEDNKYYLLDVPVIQHLFKLVESFDL